MDHVSLRHRGHCAFLVTAPGHPPQEFKVSYLDGNKSLLFPAAVDLITCYADDHVS